MGATSKKRAARGAAANERSPVVRVRGLKRSAELQLFVGAGGRCEFVGCNEYLLEHHLTLRPGNYAQAAHIVAFSARGPRANPRLPASYINAPGNLMLLCQRCHKQVDDHADEYGVARLKKDKAAHEDRIRHVTGMSASLRTTIIRVTARVAGRAPTIPYAQIAEAVDPRYPTDRKGIVIDLSRVTTSREELIGVGQKEIRAAFAQLGSSTLDGAVGEHISVFALAPIPLLVFMGRELSDKQQADFFQRHRDTEDWKWKASGPEAEYVFRQVRGGSDHARVALCLSLSGAIDTANLHPSIDTMFNVYELTLTSGPPSPLFLRRRADLDAFRRAYMIALREIMSVHQALSELHLFPAVPAPVAVVCGHALLPKVDPTLLVYDADRAKGGFTLVTSVN